MQLRSYTTVADFKGQRFAFKKDMIVQVVQKDPKGNNLLLIKKFIMISSCLYCSVEMTRYGIFLTLAH